MSVYLYTRNARTGLVRQLARRLGIRCVDAELKPRARRPKLICWGNTQPPAWGGAPRHPQWIINNPEAVDRMVNKVATFQTLNDAGIRTVEWTTDRAVAAAWYAADRSIYARTLTRGHSGDGLVYLRQANDDALIDAPLYTRNFRTPFKEYRFHVFDGRVIDVTMKRRRNGVELQDERLRLQVRTYQNGWVFTRQDIEPYMSDRLNHRAISAVHALGAQMGAVDIAAHWIDGVLQDDYSVIEVNSAPALRSATTLDMYEAALRPVVAAWQ